MKAEDDSKQEIGSEVGPSALEREGSTMRRVCSSVVMLAAISLAAAGAALAAPQLVPSLEVIDNDGPPLDLSDAHGHHHHHDLDAGRHDHHPDVVAPWDREDHRL